MKCEIHNIRIPVHASCCPECATSEVEALQAEVRRLRTECPKLIDEIDRDYNRKTNALIARHAKQLYAVVTERDRYREALLNLKKHYESLVGKDFLPLVSSYRMVCDALRGGEK